MSSAIAYHPVRKSWCLGLSELFEALVASGDNEYFHPHPLTKAEAVSCARYQGRDLYFVQTLNQVVVGYGMLRGWDEGYAIPSLGLAIHPDYRNQGLGKHFVWFLHDEARKKGATQVMLKVYVANPRAVHLYRKCGYRFSLQGEHYLGYVTL